MFLFIKDFNVAADAVQLAAALINFAQITFVDQTHKCEDPPKDAVAACVAAMIIVLRRSGIAAASTQFT